MDGSRFDSFTRLLGRSGSRRDALKALLGLGGVVTAGAIVFDDVDAARRGTSEPATTVPTPPSVPTSPAASGGRRPTQTSLPTPSCPGVVCADGCCDGACTSTGACCPAGSTVCGSDCCPSGQATCCDSACCYGNCYGEELCCPTGRIYCDGRCLPVGACCIDEDCAVGRCIQNACVPNTSTAIPTNTSTTVPSSTSTVRATDTATATSTPTDIPTSTGTPTETATGTPTHTATPTPTETSSPTGTATQSPTSTPTETSTSTATATPSSTNTATATTVDYLGRISSASSGFSGGNCVVSATASDFEPLAAIEFSLWGEGGPDPDGTVGTIPTTTDSGGSASMQYAVDPHAHREIVITASQTMSTATTRIVLNCPDPTPIPPEVTITFTTHPDDPDYCQATVTLSGFSPTSPYSIEFRILNGELVFADLVSTDSTGSAGYIVPFALSATSDVNIEAHVQGLSTSETASSGVVPIDC